MVLSHNVTLPKDTITLVWISSANVASVVNEGYRVIHAASDFFYLVCFTLYIPRVLYLLWIISRIAEVEDGLDLSQRGTAGAIHSRPGKRCGVVWTAKSQLLT